MWNRKHLDLGIQKHCLAIICLLVISFVFLPCSHIWATLRTRCKSVLCSPFHFYRLTSYRVPIEDPIPYLPVLIFPSVDSPCLHYFSSFMCPHVIFCWRFRGPNRVTSSTYWTWVPRKTFVSLRRETLWALPLKTPAEAGRTWGQYYRSKEGNNQSWGSNRCFTRLWSPGRHRHRSVALIVTQLKSTISW